MPPALGRGPSATDRGQIKKQTIMREHTRYEREKTEEKESVRGRWISYHLEMRADSLGAQGAGRWTMRSPAVAQRRSNETGARQQWEGSRKRTADRSEVSIMQAERPGGSYFGN
jgi:hypothetical protein